MNKYENTCMFHQPCQVVLTVICIPKVNCDAAVVYRAVVNWRGGCIRWHTTWWTGGISAAGISYWLSLMAQFSFIDILGICAWSLFPSALGRAILDEAVPFIIALVRRSRSRGNDVGGIAGIVLRFRFVAANFRSSAPNAVVTWIFSIALLHVLVSAGKLVNLAIEVTFCFLE